MNTRKLNFSISNPRNKLQKNSSLPHQESIIDNSPNKNEDAIDYINASFDTHYKQSDFINKKAKRISDGSIRSGKRQNNDKDNEDDHVNRI
eukprot:Pgem_evm1s17320